MFYLCDIFQFVIDRFYKRTFARHDLVRDRHQRVPHVALDLSDKLYPVDKQEFKKLSADIPLVTAEFPFHIPNEQLKIQRIAVIDIAGHKHKVKDLSAVVYYQMQFETEEPSHRTLSTFSQSLERLVYENTLVFADPQGC